MAQTETLLDINVSAGTWLGFDEGEKLNATVKERQIQTIWEDIPLCMKELYAMARSVIRSISISSHVMSAAAEMSEKRPIYVLEGGQFDEMGAATTPSVLFCLWLALKTVNLHNFDVLKSGSILSTDSLFSIENEDPTADVVCDDDMSVFQIINWDELRLYQANPVGLSLICFLQELTLFPNHVFWTFLKPDKVNVMCKFMSMPKFHQTTQKAWKKNEPLYRLL